MMQLIGAILACISAALILCIITVIAGKILHENDADGIASMAPLEPMNPIRPVLLGLIGLLFGGVLLVIAGSSLWGKNENPCIADRQHEKER